MDILLMCLWILGYMIIGCVIVLPLVIWHARTHGYICRNCGHKFTISIVKDLISPHRLLKCPHCENGHGKRKLELGNRKRKYERRTTEIFKYN